MIIHAIYHKPESEYSFVKSANKVGLRLRMAKQDMANIRVVYGNKYTFAHTQLFEDMDCRYTDDLYSYYQADIVLDDVRLVYIFEIECDGSKYYYCEDGVTTSYDYELNYYNAFQIAYINEIDIHNKVDYMSSACFYQIFVDRFCRGNSTKDSSYISMPWGTTPTPTNFAGGDLAGITDKLGYLEGLGITALYLTPIFASRSNHKYDTDDYYAIDSMFGTAKELHELVASAHGQGIKVVLDAVFNHTSDRHEFFQDVICHGNKSKYYRWFMIEGDRVDMEAVNYQCFAACGNMPKWNTSNIDVQKYLIDIAIHYITVYNIDGWRLDVSDEVSHDFWRKFRRAVKQVKPNCVIIGENWHNANSYLQGDQYDSIMNYAFTKACLDYFAFDIFSADQFASKLNNILMRNSDTVNSMMINLLDSHDTHRFLTRVGGDITKLESALAILYMFVGAPCIYYGTEIGMEGNYDPDSRRTMDWQQSLDNSKIYQITKQLINIRKKLKALHGTNIKIYSSNDVLYIERYDSGYTVRLTVNGSDDVLPLGTNICTNGEGSLTKHQFAIEMFQQIQEV